MIDVNSRLTNQFRLWHYFICVCLAGWNSLGLPPFDNASVSNGTLLHLRQVNLLLRQIVLFLVGASSRQSVIKARSAHADAGRQHSHGPLRQTGILAAASHGEQPEAFRFEFCLPSSATLR